MIKKCRRPALAQRRRSRRESRTDLFVCLSLFVSLSAASSMRSLPCPRVCPCSSPLFPSFPLRRLSLHRLLDSAVPCPRSLDETRFFCRMTKNGSRGVIRTLVKGDARNRATFERTIRIKDQPQANGDAPTRGKGKGKRSETLNEGPNKEKMLGTCKIQLDKNRDREKVLGQTAENEHA